MRLNLISATVGYMGYGAAQWLMLIALARFTSPEDVGRFSLAFALTAPLFLAVDLQLRRIVASDVADQFDARTIMRIRLATSLLTVAAVGVITVCMRTSAVQRDLNILVATAKALESISDLIYGYFQRM